MYDQQEIMDELNRIQVVNTLEEFGDEMKNFTMRGNINQKDFAVIYTFMKRNAPMVQSLDKLANKVVERYPYFRTKINESRAPDWLKEYNGELLEEVTNMLRPMNQMEIEG